MFFKINRQNSKYKKIIKKGGLFDEVFYLKTYRDARLLDMTPLEHYVSLGIIEDRKPNATFNPIWYREYHIDVKDDGAYPFIHYCIYGKKDDRFQNEDEKNLYVNKIKVIQPFFLEDSYLSANLDVKDALDSKKFDSAFEHFIQLGFKEVLKGKRRLGLEFPTFTEEEYRNANPDIQKVCTNDKNFSLYEHICKYGYKEFLKKERIFGGYYPFELNPTLLKKIKDIFDDDAYLEINSDVAKAVNEKNFKNGWEHFVKHGIEEIRKGQRQISSKVPLLGELEYVQKNEDIFNSLKDGLITSPFEHFLLFGVLEYTNGSRVLNSSVGMKYFYKEPVMDENIKKELEGFKKKPLISVVMPVYNVEPQWLERAVESLHKQWYQNWELCIADDKSPNRETLEYLKTLSSPKVKIKFLEKNLNISGASNEALSMTTGEYVALMDNDDELTVDALYEVLKAINEQDAEFIYSDEDKLEMDDTFSNPHFKPDFAPDMFLSQNYLSHLGVIKKSLIEEVGGWEIGLEGSQDYDLYLKVLEKTTKITHISKVLYHWRKIPGSTAAEYGEKSYAQEAGRQALENAMQRRSIKASVTNGLTAGTYKVNYKIIGEPLVSIIVPFKDKPELLTMCIESILNKSTYKNFEIIGISNNSEEKETFDAMKSLASLDKRIKFYEYNVPFNYSDINNHAVNEYAQGEHVLFLNNDIEVITPEWIEELLMHSQRKEVGVVGAKLFFPDNTIQHAGLVMAPYTSHSVLTMYSRHNKDEYGYVSRAMCINNYSAVTAACMMVKKSLFKHFGGFDSKNLKVAYNDVDFCLTLLENNFNNIFTPYSNLFHYESVSRGYERELVDIERVEKEKFYLKKQHPVFFETDKFYNKNLALDAIDSSFNYNNSVHYKAHIALPFEENIILSKNFRNKIKDKVCIFSHFDKHNTIDEYVLYYVSELSKVADIIFVSTAEELKNIDVLEDYCRDVVVKENYGYDFAAWKSGLNLLGKELDQYDELIFCNDSMFGPFFELAPIFDRMSKNYDVWSMTENKQVATHLQSYFVVYTKRAFQHSLFKEFWDDFKIYIDKTKLIEMNEIKFSEKLLNCSDLKIGSYISSEQLDSYLNVTHYYWRTLINEYKFPFIKKELLRDNPMNIDIKNWKSIINKNSVYSVALIQKHLERT